MLYIANSDQILLKIKQFRWHILYTDFFSDKEYVIPQSKEDTDAHMENIKKCNLIKKNYTLKHSQDYDADVKNVLLGDIKEKDAFITPKDILVRPFTIMIGNRYGDIEFKEPPTISIHINSAKVFLFHSKIHYVSQQYIVKITKY